MPKPPDMTDEEWEIELEKRATERLQEQQRERVTRNGFESYAYEVDPEDKCERAVTRKVRNRWTCEPCGKQALVQLKFAAPDYPDGVKVRFCRTCLGEVIKDLVGYLQG